MQQNTQTWSEGTEAYLGGVLESLKVVYALRPVTPVKKSAPAEPRKSSHKPSSAKKSKKSGKKKTI